MVNSEQLKTISSIDLSLPFVRATSSNKVHINRGFLIYEVYLEYLVAVVTTVNYVYLITIWSTTAYILIYTSA